MFSHQASPPSRRTPSRRGSSRPIPSISDNPSMSSILPEFFDKQAPTFTSCLSIPVEGAISIERPDLAQASTAHAVNGQSSTSDSKRAPRKSKTDALQALQHHAQASNSPQDDLPDNMHDDAGVRVRLRDGPPISVKSTLNMSSVKTPKQRTPPSRPRERPFGLSDCPTFRPTPEQFKDPMAYIKSISENARTYGMCKIVPPLGWDMPFVTDTELFRFKTRLQRLNSIEASSRAKVNFLEQLYRFHKQQGNPRVSVPTINHKPLDLWLLRKEVIKMGGYEVVTKGKKWADLGRLLGYGGVPGLSTQLRNSYTRVILPYEHFCERVRSSPNMAYNKPRDPQLKTHVNIQSSSKQNGADDSPPSSPLTATSSPLSEPPDESDLKDMKSETKTRRSTRQTSPERQGTSRPDTHNARTRSGSNDHKAELQCEVCQKKDRGEEMLLCDGCDCGFHMFCLDPPLASIPKGQWFCHICLFGTGGDFGFDEGEEHSLSSFQARDLEFRKLWFQSHAPDNDGSHVTSNASGSKSGADPAVNRFGDVVVTETDVEHEFWRLVQSSTETVEVEYGADVHSTTHGSGMPTLETHPLNPYSKDPWNLNNIPILPDSLLRFIKSDISGMTVPWTYVGMVFSTFCWHNEDHYTYSINYMHWGETKTWYSVPGSDAAKFEAAIRKEAPDLFEAQPDLLFQLVTLMNPQRLKDAGVDVYACNQRAGEFVITFPKAYHAGFNHGFNFNEAVNFALPDWLPLGLECVRRYQEHRKLPVFSHDELLITITQQSQTIKTAMWLNKSLTEMMDREMKARATARELALTEVLEESDRTEEQYQCHICKVFCYLSQITCKCTSQVVCINHVDELCECSQTSKTFRKRFSDSELKEIHTKVAERASIPTQWRQKLGKLLMESARPPLRSLRALLTEGDRISYPLVELHSLRKCVGRASEWVAAANSFTTRKTVRRGRRVRVRGSASESSIGTLAEEAAERPDRGLADVYTLLREVEDLGFDCDEISTLQSLAREVEEIKAKAKTLLETMTSVRERDAYIQECDHLITYASTLNVHVDEIVEVEKIVMREQLLKELEVQSGDDTLNLADIRDYVLRGRACNLSSENKHMSRLESRLRAGEGWEVRAKELLGKPQRTLEELEAFSKAHEGIPVDPALLDRLSSARSRAVEYEKQATAWLLAPQVAPDRPRVQDVVKMVQRAEKDFNIPVIKDLKRTVEFAVDLETRCENVMKHRYVHPPTEDPDVFKTFLNWREYAERHLQIFTMPNFDRFDRQLTTHYRWMESLPWYCRQHRAAHGKSVLDDVVESTRPEDDLPPNDEYFTCICTTPVRPPAPGTVSDAVQCDHCFARFHGVCAANGGSCPFCDHQHWNGTLHKERSWHFCYLPTILLHAPDVTKGYSEDWKQLEIIVHRMDRLSSVIGQFLSFASQPTNQRQEYIPQVRHYMRKLYKIQFAVSPNPEVSFGLDLAGLHRILAGQPAPVRLKKRRRPKFIFGQDNDKDWADGTRCICRGRTAYLLRYPAVECEHCKAKYHAGCVFFPLEAGVQDRFMCPLCCLRKNKTYTYSEVRVKHVENQDPSVYVNTKEMLETFSKDIIYTHLDPPVQQTLFVELIRFTPGQPESIVPGSGPQPRPLPPAPPPPAPIALMPAPQPQPQMNGNPGTLSSSSAASSHPPSHASSHPPSHPPPHPRAIHPIAAYPTALIQHHGPPHGHPHVPSPPAPDARHAPHASHASDSHHVPPPPPPWSSRGQHAPPPLAGSRWSSAAATAPPPTARSHHAEHPSPRAHTPPTQSRKRKHSDDPNVVTEEILLSTNSPHMPSPKRRHSNAQTPTMQPARTNQGLSPSLAMMLSPQHVDPRSPHTAPRSPHVDPRSPHMDRSPHIDRSPHGDPRSPPRLPPPPQSPAYQSRPVSVIHTGVRVPEEAPPSQPMMSHTAPIRPMKALYNGREQQQAPPPQSTPRWTPGSSSMDAHPHQPHHSPPPPRR